MIKQLIKNAEIILRAIQNGRKSGICLEQNYYFVSCSFCKTINPEFKIEGACPCHLDITKEEHIKRLTKFIEEQKLKDREE